MRTSIALAISIVGAAASFDIAAAQERGNACHAIKTDSDRLACYDQQTGFLVSEKEPVKEASTGQQWHKSEENSSLDGRTDVWLSVDSKNSQPNQIGSPEKARLWVRCMNNSTNLFITFNDYTRQSKCSLQA